LILFAGPSLSFDADQFSGTHPQPIDASKPFVTENQVSAAARASAEVTTEKRGTLPVKTSRSTIGAINLKLGITDDPQIMADRPVWVVTVYGDKSVRRPDGSTVSHQVYTSVYDAPSGYLILDAIGVDAFR